MKLNEFKKQPRDSYAFDHWIWNKTVATPLGKFSVDFQIFGEDPPDDEMLRRAAELVGYMERNGEQVLDVLFGSYLQAYEQAREDGYLDFMDIPEGLTRKKVCKYVDKDSLSLVVSRDEDLDEGYESAICLSPEWDEENALSLEFRDGQIVSVNGEAFKLVDGVLRLGDEDDED